MNYVISVINPNGLSILGNICEKLELSVVLSMKGAGTATESMRSVLGLDSNEKRVVMVVANEERTKSLILEQKRRLYIDAPGNGIVISVPVKSVGGGNTLANLGGKSKMKAPELNFDFELVLAIANEGHTDTVMDAARSAGAGGGTVIHAKGTGGTNAEKFFKVSIAQEKEIILIVAKASEKAKIMQSIIENAGTHTDAGAIVFSLPVSDVAGFGSATLAES